MKPTVILPFKNKCGEKKDETEWCIAFQNKTQKAMNEMKPNGVLPLQNTKEAIPRVKPIPILPLKINKAKTIVKPTLLLPL